MVRVMLILILGLSLLSSSTELKKVKFYKNFKANHYTKKAGGTGASLYASSYFLFDENGLRGGVYLKSRAKILGQKINDIIKIRYRASIDPSSFVNTYSDVSMTLFGARVYIDGSSMNDKTGAKVSDVKLDSSVAKTNTELKQKTRAAKMKNAQNLMSSYGDPLIGIYKDRSYELSMASLSRTMFIGPVPLYLKFNAGGKVGVDTHAGLVGLTQLEGAVTPYVNLTADGRLGLGAGFSFSFEKLRVSIKKDFEYSFGLGSSLTLISNDFECKLTGGLKYNANDEYITSIDGQLSESITNTFKGPRGSIYRYVKYYGPKLSDIMDFFDHGDIGGLLDWSDRYYRKNISSFRSTQKKNKLMDKKQNVFTLPLYSEDDDILLYAQSSCQGEDIGAFSSGYNADVNCKESLSCEDNQAKSLLIRQGVPVGTKIYLYDHPNKKTTKNDYAYIRVNSDLTQDVCVNGFQHQTTSDEKAQGISLKYYKKGDTSRLTGYVSHVKVRH